MDKKRIALVVAIIVVIVVVLITMLSADLVNKFMEMHGGSFMDMHRR